MGELPRTLDLSGSFLTTSKPKVELHYDNRGNLVNRIEPRAVAKIISGTDLLGIGK